MLTFVLLEKIARFRRVYVRGAAEYRTQGERNDDTQEGVWPNAAGSPDSQGDLRPAVLDNLDGQVLDSRRRGLHHDHESAHGRGTNGQCQTDSRRVRSHGALVHDGRDAPPKGQAMTLDQVIADARGQAAVLRTYGAEPVATAPGCQKCVKG